MAVTKDTVDGWLVNQESSQSTRHFIFELSSIHLNLYENWLMLTEHQALGWVQTPLLNVSGAFLHLILKSPP